MNKKKLGDKTLKVSFAVPYNEDKTRSVNIPEKLPAEVESKKSLKAKKM